MFTLRRDTYPIMIIILFAAVLSIGASLSKSNLNIYRVFSAVPPEVPQITPTAEPQIKNESEANISPDGGKTLSLKKIISADTGNYLLYVETAGTDGQSLVYSRDKSANPLTLPYNSWSPDDRDFFVREISAPSDNYLVFHADGEPFSDAAKYIDIGARFREALPDYKIDDVTGWAAPGLLVVNTTSQDGQLGPSFWFDTGSRSFIQLSTHFY